MAEDAKAFGLDPARLPMTAARSAEGELIYPENWPAVTVFLALSNAWTLHIPAMGGKPLWRGLPRGEIVAVLRLLNFWRERHDLLPRLFEMESAALAQLNRP